MPKVTVGGRAVNVSWAEYFCAILPKGTPVEFTVKRIGREPLRGCGVSAGSMFYDGVTGFVDVGAEKWICVDAAFGDRIRRVRDAAKLPFIGAGI